MRSHLSTRQEMFLCMYSTSTEATLVMLVDSTLKTSAAHFGLNIQRVLTNLRVPLYREDQFCLKNLYLMYKFINKRVDFISNLMGVLLKAYAPTISPGLQR